ncbi:hypothetical protein GCM10027071_20150 [Microbacterium marinum]
MSATGARNTPATKITLAEYPRRRVPGIGCVVVSLMLASIGEMPCADLLEIGCNGSGPSGHVLGEGEGEGDR